MQSFTACMPLLTASSHLDYGEDAGVLLNSVIYIVSVPPICRSQYTFCEKSHRFVPFFTELNKISCFCWLLINLPLIEQFILLSH